MHVGILVTNSRGLGTDGAFGVTNFMNSRSLGTDGASYSGSFGIIGTTGTLGSTYPGSFGTDFKLNFGSVGATELVSFGTVRSGSIGMNFLSSDSLGATGCMAATKTTKTATRQQT